MIVVDTSVWIGHMRRADTSAVAKLRAIENPRDILVGDIILLELLQGARDERHAKTISSNMSAYLQEPMLSVDLAQKTARNFRLLRAAGITIRKTSDLIIGTYCIEFGHYLLHEDRDFEPMVKHLDLKTL